MVEKYKWYGVVGILLPLLVLSIFFLFYNSDLTFNREGYIKQKSFDGIVINKRDSQHGFHELTILSKGNKAVVFDTGLLNIKFSKFVTIGDSVLTISGDSTIKVFRGDSVYVFHKIEWTSYIVYKR